MASGFMECAAARTTSEGPASTRWVAAWTALLLVALALVVPPSAASAEERVPTVVEAEQLDTWGEGEYLDLKVAVTLADGTPVERGGRVRASVDGVVRPLVGLSADHAQIRALPLVPGPHEVRLEFSGNEELAPSVWARTLEVVAGTVPSTMTLSGAGSAEYGTAPTATVTVQAGGAPADGMVALLWDGGSVPATTVPLSGGSAVIPLAPEPGAHTYEVVFYGGQGAMPSRASGSFVLERAHRTLKVWSNDVQGGLWYTGSRTMEVAVYVPDLGRLDGEVSLYDGSRLLRREHVDSTYTAAHTFQLSARELSTGKHTLVAKVTGSPYVEDMRATMAVTVRKYWASLALERAGQPWAWGTPHKLRVSALPQESWRDSPVPDGTVTVYRGSRRVGRATVDGDGFMTMTLGAKALPVGKVRLRAVYSGDGLYYGRTTYRTVRVEKARTRTSATLVDRSLTRSQRPKTVVTVKARPGVALTGRLVVKVDGTTVKTVRLTKGDKGRRTIRLPRVERGHHYFTVYYKATATTKASVSRNANYFTVR
ncbi:MULTISPECIES: Ig-like domain-containing protein [unclassified Isoptericola]|uniref:Ig-like domain-containing protein n=1 Tax=unclassified Isoptericola TaxID=2623355 RepID=UPI00365ADF7F